ncbi:GMC family oxidoreductase [Micromonospora sp. 4G55]|uniref:GMC family oxidoreductase n=1 Tax=Micromonospora sp. 4G55 TaxID=2806102 RepID=UPI001A50314D|nr:GMC family oxidoreductase N-terminal domain-containing protein [Micromonospora sp. 4G55]MBM0255774.1 GMC family oxidoreductase N-terminal domain-containing protein [Micromonospora sp. 4G55]
MKFDYVIVGAGAAGSVLANRLSENPSNKVLLLEYGGADINPMHYIPKGFFFTLRGERYSYHYPTQPIGPSGQIEAWTRGKVTGGSTTINGMMYTRGAPADYDAIVERGNPGWGWDDMLPAFKAMEDHQLGPSPMRGAGGPYGVSISEDDDEVTTAILAAAEKVGWQRSTDTNAHDDERIGFTPSSIKNGVRVSAASAFLRPALKRPNLTYLKRTKVGYLLFDGHRVVGVRATRKGSGYQDYLAAKEVILSAGTIESTLLLERSGIGRPEVLRGVGVDVVVESPNVGERVIEQRGVSFQVKLKDQIGLTQRLNSVPKEGWEGFKYLLTRRGPIATGGYDLLSAFKSSPELERPDIQGIWLPMALDASSPTMKLAKHSGFMFVGYKIRPTTEGSIHLGGRLPENAPLINARFLETEEDRTATSKILDRAREVVAQSPVADLVQEEEFPGPKVSTPEEVLRYSIDTGGGIYHAIGSAAMGPNDDDVVDSRLRVRGVSGLRVIDASVFRQQPSGNTAAPTMALAWRAADLIEQGE